MSSREPLDDLGREGEEVDSALVDVELLEVEHARRIGIGRTLWCEETAEVIPPLGASGTSRSGASGASRRG